MLLANFTKKLIVFPAIFLITAFSKTTEEIETIPLIPAKALQADLLVLKKAYKELHPDLCRYNSKTQMEANFKQLSARLNHDLSLRQDSSPSRDSSSRSRKLMRVYLKLVLMREIHKDFLRHFAFNEQS